MNDADVHQINYEVFKTFEMKNFIFKPKQLKKKKACVMPSQKRKEEEERAIRAHCEGIAFHTEDMHLSIPSHYLL